MWWVSFLLWRRIYDTLYISVLNFFRHPSFPSYLAAHTSYLFQHWGLILFDVWHESNFHILSGYLRVSGNPWPWSVSLSLYLLSLYLVNQDESSVIFGKIVIALTRCQINMTWENIYFSSSFKSHKTCSQNFGWLPHRSLR